MSHCWKNSSCVVLVSPFLRDTSDCFWTEIQGCEGKKAVLIHCSDLPQTGNFWTMKTFSVVYKKIPSGEQKCTLISITLQFSNRLFPWRGSFFCSTSYATSVFSEVFGDVAILKDVRPWLCCCTTQILIVVQYTEKSKHSNIQSLICMAFITLNASNWHFSRKENPPHWQDSFVFKSQMHKSTCSATTQLRKFSWHRLTVLC